MIFNDVVFQGVFFAASLFCGLCCGIFYHIFYTVRYLTKCGRVITFLLDVAFCILSLFFAFIIFYPLNGFDIKWYIILGYFVGFCIERYSFSKPVDFVCKKIYNAFTRLKKAAGKLHKKIKRQRGNNLNDGETASSKG